ncbi:MAG: glycerol-3-phosphate dehydrogenase [Anaerolineales bacterium]|nr:glycerol-3-phosphate dehydrogenase [Anaerolineales bacterium]
MANIVILGAGVMGTAISTPLADNGHRVHLVGTHLDTDIIEEIHQNRFHPKLRTPVANDVHPFTHLDLDLAMQDVDLVILGVNSLGISWAAEQLSTVLPPETPVVAVTKGLAGDGEKLHLLPDVFRSGLPADIQPSVQVAAIGGPSIAGELAVRRHTSIVLTGRDEEHLDKIAALFRTPYYHIWTSTDMVGVEVCVALKNLYALAIGMVRGLLELEGLANNDAAMHNLAAAIFAQGLWESAFLVQLMGGELSNVYSLAGAGDLFVTSVAGRNVRMGRLLGLGEKYKKAKEQHFPDDTVEGAELAIAIGDTIEHMLDRGKLETKHIPLMRKMIHIIRDEEAIEIPWDDFFQFR